MLALSSSEIASDHSQKVHQMTCCMRGALICLFSGLDASAPIGPVLVSHAAISDPHALKIKAIHNGSVVQDDSTK